jgi:multicomponent Na+:H+ antiporter subunit D
MFLASGTVKEAAGTDRFEDLSGLVESSRILAAAFFIGAVSLVGIPPTLGFFGKFGVFLAARSYPLVLAVALLGGVLTIIYMSRTWNSVFWGERSGSYSFEPGAVGATLVLASLLLALGLGFEAVNLASEAAAEAVLDQQAYTEAVLGDGS